MHAAHQPQDGTDDFFDTNDDSKPDAWDSLDDKDGEPDYFDDNQDDKSDGLDDNDNGVWDG
jgi:hypothetical protein